MAAGSFPASGDCDGNGEVSIDELVLGARMVLDPGLLSRCPAFDLNGDGRVTVDELLRAIDLALHGVPPTPTPTVSGDLVSLVSSSPAHGEGGVAITRETILRFSGPLDPTTVTPQSIHADFGGGRLVNRFHLSPDRRTLTLFYDVALPAASRIRVTIDGNRVRAANGSLVDADQNGSPGGVGRIDFDTLAIATVPGTAVCGRVFASELIPGQSGQSLNVPLQGVTILVDGMEDWHAVTDPNGNFRLEPAPAGRFFVFIKGTTATNNVPPGAYYPNVGKAWVSIAGVETNIGEIFLPLIQAGTLQPVSATEDTVIRFAPSVLETFPEFADVRITVPADSLYADDGTRGGMVGIAPVAPDRIPSRLPPGLNFPLVITVQTDGAENFDRPVPVCFPNLPDPKTGKPLAPGAESALWSFNHDTGEFEVVGPMRVTADGRLVCTEPGVGILAPGWHGTGPGASGSGGPLNGPADDDDQEKGGDSPPPGGPSGEQCREESGAGDDVVDPVYLFSGEFYEEVEDLRIKGRGLDFIWSRKYRSKIGPNTVQGNGWDFSYNISIIPDNADLIVCDGNSRRDRYLPGPLTFSQGAGGAAGAGAVYRIGAGRTWSRPEHFNELILNEDGTLTLLFPDLGQWVFNPLDGRPAQGKIRAIIDRNGNRLTFAYDGQGRLRTITDTLDRNVTVAYNADGFIESVTDFIGRQVRYEYYRDGDAGGSFGDLKSVRSPVVTGTPNGNDFPNGRLTTYTYTKGFADERLNHNLLTITDGRRNDPNDPTFGQGPYLVNVYASTQDSSNVNFDRVVRQQWGGPKDIIDIVYVPQTPSAANGGAYMKTIVNDRVGNVKEYFFEPGNRVVIRREYTGRAIPDRPTTETANRPLNKLRADDPHFFETRYEWNDDAQMTRVIHPRGNSTEYVYESELHPQADPRRRGNLRIVRHRAGPLERVSDQAVIEERFEYDERFGCGRCAAAFVTRLVDGRGNETRHEYDDRGNRTRTVHPIPSIVDQYEYNEFGQMTAHVLPDNGSGHRRRDELRYHTSGPQRGYLRERIVDAAGLSLTTRYEYDPVGHMVRQVDPRGNDLLSFVNALGEIVRVTSRRVRSGGPRQTRDFFYDANGNLRRIDVENRDALGQLQANSHFTTTLDYETLNRIVRRSEEVDASRSIVTELAYDANRNVTLVRFGEATRGRQPASTRRRLYDERDLLFREILAEGTAEQTTTQQDYDGNGNLRAIRRGLEAEPRVTLQEYDGFDRMTRLTNPMGNVRITSYDAGGNLVRVRVDGELVDRAGGNDNVRLAEVELAYDALNRLTAEARAFFLPETQTAIGDGSASTSVFYSDNSQIVRVVDDNGNQRTALYDSANRLRTLTDAKGNSTTYGYDANGNVVSVSQIDRSDLGDEKTFVAVRQYDGLDRIERAVDSAGNSMTFSYDSRGNQTSVTDARGNVTRLSFDGLDRVVEMVHELTASGAGGPAVDTIRITQEWDDNSRLLRRVDDNGNAVEYEYDALNRRTNRRLADGTVLPIVYDVHGNGTLFTDANGSVVRTTYDLLDRPISRVVERGPGVLGAASLRFAYDGLSRVVRAEDEDSLVLRRYDSLSHLIAETLNGETTESSWDGEGNQLSLTYPGGRVISTSYDELDRKRVVADGARVIASYSYSGRNRVIRRDYGNGTRTSFAYDDVRRITAITHTLDARGAATVFDDRRFAWDASHNKIERTLLVPPGGRASFRYDSVDQLVTSALTPGGTIQYGLDGVGNRRQVSGGPDAGSYELSEVVPEPAAFQVNQYSRTPFDTRRYDANGNLTAIDRAPADGTPEIEMAYDYRNQMVRHHDRSANVTTSYAYDALGRRIAKVVDDGTPDTTLFFYDRWREIEERDGTGATRATFVYGIYLDEPLQMQRDGENFFLHADDLYSVIAATDDVGRVVERYSYDDYGAPTILDPAGGVRGTSVIGNPYLFTGRRYDAESGLYSYRTRYLDPRSGRFTSLDPLGIWSDLDNLGNGYTYVGNNPLRHVDPFGLAAAPALGGAIVEVTADMIVAELAIIEGGAAAGGTGAAGAAAGAATVAGAAGAAAAVGVVAGTIINHFAEDYIQSALDFYFGDENMPDPFGGDSPSADTEIDQPPIDDPVIDGEPVKEPADQQRPDDNQRRRRRCERDGGGFFCTVTCTFAPKPGCEGRPCPPQGNFSAWARDCGSACAEAKRKARQNMPAHCVANCN